MIIATLIVGFLLFALMYWPLNLSFNDSLIAAISGTAGGILGPYVWKWLNKKIQKKTAK